MDDQIEVRDVGAANLRFARALVGELQAAGIATAFICPGSRSTPLALAVAEHPRLRHSVHVDERSAAFQALGFAKASGRPVMLLCTSGTAGANFLPAVAEAAQSRVPLVVLTADRPPELRAWGAAQTMEQRTLYAGFTRWSEEAPCPSERGAGDHYARALARRAVIEATGFEPGPVHLNLPFREPLLPASIDEPEFAARETVVEFEAASVGFDPALAESLATELRDIERGVLLFGPDRWDPVARPSRPRARCSARLADHCRSGIGLARGFADRWRDHPRRGPAAARCRGCGRAAPRTGRALRRPADQCSDCSLDGDPSDRRRLAGRSRQRFP